jgi:hypothetical protein
LMLIEFLTDAITSMDGFRDDIATVYVYEEHPKKWVATGNHPKKLLFYRVAPSLDLSGEITAPAYLGALSYLRAILSSALMRDNPRLELTYQEKDNKPTSVLSMKFLAKRFESQFQCTHPGNLNDKERIRQFPRPDDAIFFSITKDMKKDFEDAARFGTPKADMRLVTLTYDGTYLRAIFGAGTHTTTLVLTDTLTGNTETKFSKQVSLDRFRTMLKVAADNHNAKGGFHPNAVWVDFNTTHSLHTIVSPTIRDQVK